MKGYKGFDKDMKCRGVQYEVGKEFSVNEEQKIYENDLHFCKYPLDLFAYYEPTISKFVEVEATGEIRDENPNNDSNDIMKVYTNKLKVYKEIGILDLIHAAIEYIKDNINTSKAQKTVYSENKNIDGSIISTSDSSATINTDNKSISTNTGERSSATNTGNRSIATNIGNRSSATNTGKRSAATSIGISSVAINTGDNSVVTSTGNSSAATSTGDSSVAINTGKRSATSSTGNRSTAINTGISGIATNTGDDSAATSTGDTSAATSTGYNGAAIVTGKNSVAVSIGCKGIAKGSLGSWIVLAEWVCGSTTRKTSCIVKDVQCFKVDGKTILPNTFYKLVDGKPVVKEVDEEMKALTEVKLK